MLVCVSFYALTTRLAGQKGTGKWTAISALENGMPVTLIGEAVFARCLSSVKDERARASEILSGPRGLKFTGDKKAFIEDIKYAVYAAKIISYAQGFMLLREAGKANGWHLNFGAIALMWRGGCIIRRYRLYIPLTTVSFWLISRKLS
jgi:6-phosphogluconate dehydrogenase